MTANSGLEAALARATEELALAGIPHMLIGGLALSAWAIPRATLDIDLTVWVSAEDLDRVCANLTAAFVSRIGNPPEFVRKTRVLPVSAESGARIDFIFAAFPFEKEMIDRATERHLGGVAVRVATLEDLILLKLPSPRPKDRDDVHLILNSYGPELDWGYLLPVADLLAAALDQPQVAAFLRTHRASLK